MKLIIHDLTEEQLKSSGLDTLPADTYRFVNSLEIDRYCIGCFGCWLKTPGRCIITDRFQQMGELIAQVDEVVIIAKETFGSYSSSVKNVLDRSISYVEPFFEIRNGEMHHKERYIKPLMFSAVFYGADITEAEEETSRRLVQANAVNLNGTIGFVKFMESPDMVKEVLA
ncbi:MAG: flavodoxin family protein [Firmicutes bacterium]|nr:flavodoxin family protein [Bacillota bacterium]